MLRQRTLNLKKYIILIIHDMKEQKIFSMTFTINIPKINNDFLLWCGETFFWGKGKTGFCFWQHIVGCPSWVPSFNVLLFTLQTSPHITFPVHLRLELCFLDLFWLGSVPVGIPIGTLCGWIVPLVPPKTRPLLWWVREAWKMQWTFHSAPKPHPWPRCSVLWFGCNST